MHGPIYTEGQIIFLHNPSTTQRLSPKLHSFWHGPYKITQVVSEMNYKICEIDTNKELIVHYDRMKPCPSPPGGFKSPGNTPPAPMQPPKEPLNNSFPAECHSCFCEAPISFTPTVSPVAVSSSVPIIQPAPHTTFVSIPVANDNLPTPLRPWRKKHFQTAHLIPPCLILIMFLKSLTHQVFPSTQLVLPRPFSMTHFRSSTTSFLLPGPFSP